MRKGREIFDKLKQGILDGKYVPGKEFPSIVQLMRRFDVSRVTAVRVTKDVRVTGCNDSSYAAALEPALTTVRMPCADIAATDYRFLMERIADPSLPIRECYLKATLVERVSTIRS